MYPVHAPFLDAVGANLLPEAGGIAGKGLGQGFLRQDGVNEPADHGVLAGADQVQILPLDLVHHALHFRKAHDPGDHVAADHIGRNEVSKSPVNHEIPGVGKNGGVEPGNVAAKVVEAVAAGFPCAVYVNAVELLHNLHMVGHLKVRHNGLAETLHLYVFVVVPADGHRFVNDIGNHQHDFANPSLQIGFQGFGLGKFLGKLCNLRLLRLRFLLLPLCHQPADSLADGLALVPQCIALHLGFSVLLVQFHNLVHQRQLFILKFLFDVFLDQFRICPDQLHINHDLLSCIEFVPRGTIVFPIICYASQSPVSGRFSMCQLLRQCRQILFIIILQDQNTLFSALIHFNLSAQRAAQAQLHFLVVAVPSPIRL